MVSHIMRKYGGHRQVSLFSHIIIHIILENAEVLLVIGWVVVVLQQTKMDKQTEN